MALWNDLIDFADRRQYPNHFIIVDMDGTLADCGHRRHKAFLGWKHKGGCPLKQNSDAEGCKSCSGKAKMNWDIFYDGIEDDPVIEPIYDLVRMLQTANDGYGDPYTLYDLIVVSGRPIDKAGKATEDWLKKHSICPRHLLMRNGGDSRPDYEIKEEILDKMISSGLDLKEVAYVIDDRNQVVNMWRRRGLTCLQVADGDF
jgi:hypothetical protein